MLLASNEYFDEFLFRGRPPGSDQLAAWHLVIAEYRSRPDGRIAVEEPRTLSAERALAEGVDLPDAIKAINLEVMAQAEKLQLTLAASQEAQKMAAEGLARIEAERDAVIAGRDELTAILIRLREKIPPGQIAAALADPGDDAGSAASA